MPVSFRGQQRADDEGIRQGSTPIKYAVKQEDFIGGEGFGAFGLDAPLRLPSFARRQGNRHQPPSRKQNVEAGKPVEERSSELGMQVSESEKRPQRDATAEWKTGRERSEGYGSTFTPSASSSSTMTPVSSV